MEESSVVNQISPIQIGGVNVLPFESMEHVLTTIFSDDGLIKPGMAVAVNPEKVLKAIDDSETKKIINEAQFPYADGIGVVKALQQKKGKKLCRIAGCELWLEVLKRSSQFNSRVLLVGAKPEVVEKTNAYLTTNGVNVVGYMSGYFKNTQEVFDLASSVKPDIVIAALGSPKQEKLIKMLMLEHQNAFFMGVGGSFDVLTGNVNRAPKGWQKLNLEWLYRMLKEPRRIFRQAKLLKFLQLYLLKKL